MKGIYIAAIDSCEAKEKGVINKIYGQIKAFKKLNVEMDIAHIKNKDIIFNGNLSNIKLYKPTNFFFHKNIKKKLKTKIKDYDFAYIRFSRGDIEYFRLIKFLNKNNIKVIIEIPTYPYIKQYKYTNPKHLIYGILDLVIWQLVKKYIYRISVTNNISKIRGIKCINIYNGIDLDSLPLNSSKKISNKLNLVGVANISKWHGYDRVIRGLYEYNKNSNSKNINFYVIGEGEEKENLIKLSKDLGLEKNVRFLGVKTGKHLNRELDNMHIGVSSLALFRAGGGHDPIKPKEFIGRGMPVILGYNDKLVDMNLPYVFKIPEDNSSVNIDEIVDKFYKLQESKQDIRDYAKANLSWESQIYKLIRQINTKNDK